VIEGGGGLRPDEEVSRGGSLRARGKISINAAALVEKEQQ